MKEISGTTELHLCINGDERRAGVRPGDTLLRVLREKLGLTGTKCGCENGDCGACTVLLDGKPVKSCMILAVECEGLALTTIEGLRDHPVQQAFAEENGFQCGFCTNGMVFAAGELLRENPNADEANIRRAISGNLCRCTGYDSIVEAVKVARDKLAAISSSTPAE